MNKKVKSFKDIKKLMSQGDHNKPNEFGVELEDHINISLHSKFNLGKFLDPGYASFFEYPGLGKFRTSLNLVYWLRDPSHNDALRTCKRKAIINIIDKQNFKPLDNHKAILLHAKYLQVMKNDRIIKEIKDLPDGIKVLSYRIHPDSGLRITTGYALIVIPVMRALIHAVKNDIKPEYTQFLNVNALEEKGFIPHTIKFGILSEENPIEKPKRRRRRRRKPVKGVTTTMNTRGKTMLDVDGDVIVTSEGFILEGDVKRVTISPDGISTERKVSGTTCEGVNLASNRVDEDIEIDRE